MLDQKLLSDLKEKLLEEKQSLEKLLASFATKDPKMKGDWDTRFPSMGEKSSFSSGALEERQDEIEEYESGLSEEFALEDRLKEVTKALKNIEEGSYGKCEKCGGEIPLERMQANPAALTDVEHAE